MNNPHTLLSNDSSEQPSRIYAIGDIHGCLDLLEGVIAAIERDHADRGGRALTVTVGDYMDRGPQSRGVIERLAANPFPTPYVGLKGNHEQLFETFLADASVGEHWRKLGGVETLASFGVPVADVMLGRNAQQASDDLAKVLTGAHRQFFNSLRTSFVTGPYYFCLAGVRPGVPLQRQSEDDLHRNRSEFLNSRADFG